MAHIEPPTTLKAGQLVLAKVVVQSWAPPYMFDSALLHSFLFKCSCICLYLKHRSPSKSGCWSTPLGLLESLRKRARPACPRTSSSAGHGRSRDPQFPKSAKALHLQQDPGDGDINGIANGPPDQYLHRSVRSGSRSSDWFILSHQSQTATAGKESKRTQNASMHRDSSTISTNRIWLWVKTLAPWFSPRNSWPAASICGRGGTNSVLLEKSKVC